MGKESFYERFKKQKAVIYTEAFKEEGVTRIYLYGDICDSMKEGAANATDDEPSFISPDLVRSLLKDAGDDKIELHLHSFGGAYFSAVAIYNYLMDRKNRIEVIIDGVAASGAACFAMAGDKVKMYEGSSFLVHNVWTMGYGNVDQMRKIATNLDKMDQGMKSMLKKRFQGSESSLDKLLNAERWLSADEALQYGFVDEIISGEALVT